MEQKTLFAYSRNILLGPAIGDWTTIQFHETDFNDYHIHTVHSTNFDSLPKDHLKYVHYIHYRLAGEIASKISADLDIKIELHSIVATQLCYEDFVNAQEDKIIQSNLIINQKGKVNMILDWELAEMIVDRLTGGKGEPSGAEQFSDIEISILKTQIDQTIPFFCQAWKSVIKPEDITKEFIAGKYNRDKKIAMREAYIVFTINLFFGKNDFKRIRFAYPSAILRALLEMRKKVEDPLKQRVALKQQTLKNIKVPMKVILGHAELKMSELKQLQAGDIIPLDNQIENPLELQIQNGRVKFSVQPGIIGNRIGAQIISLDKTEKPVLKAYPILNEEKKSNKKTEAQKGAPEKKDSLDQKANRIELEMQKNDIESTMETLEDEITHHLFGSEPPQESKDAVDQRQFQVEATEPAPTTVAEKKSEPVVIEDLAPAVQKEAPPIENKESIQATKPEKESDIMSLFKEPVIERKKAETTPNDEIKSVAMLFEDVESDWEAEKLQNRQTRGARKEKKTFTNKPENNLELQETEGLFDESERQHDQSTLAAFGPEKRIQSSDMLFGGFEEDGDSIEKSL